MLSHIAFPGTKSYCHGMLFSYFSGFDSLMFYIELFTSTFTVIWSHLGPVLLNVKKNMIWKIMGPHEFDGLFKGCMAESNRIGGHIWDSWLSSLSLYSLTLEALPCPETLGLGKKTGTWGKFEVWWILFWRYRRCVQSFQ